VEKRRRRAAALRILPSSRAVGRTVPSSILDTQDRSVARQRNRNMHSLRRMERVFLFHHLSTRPHRSWLRTEREAGGIRHRDSNADSDKPRRETTHILHTACRKHPHVPPLVRPYLQSYVHLFGAGCFFCLFILACDLDRSWRRFGAGCVLVGNDGLQERDMVTHWHATAQKIKRWKEDQTSARGRRLVLGAGTRGEVG